MLAYVGFFCTFAARSLVCVHMCATYMCVSAKNMCMNYSGISNSSQKGKMKDVRAVVVLFFMSQCFQGSKLHVFNSEVCSAVGL